MAKKGSKNNISNRGKAAEMRKVGGRSLVVFLYDGTNVGHGKYMAGKFSDDGKIFKDTNGKPIPYGSIISS